MENREREAVALLNAPGVEIEELPLKVVPDWDEQVERADEMAKVIDRHLDYEARGRLLTNLQDFRPQHLCPEQRVQMISDMYGSTL